MGIKSKKCKSIISFICLVLGISLLISSSINGIFAALIERNEGYSIEDAFTFDYQETTAFRDSIAGYLQNFLAMAAGEPIAYYEGAYHSWRRGFTGSVGVVEEAADVSVASTAASDTGVQQQEDEEAATSPQENKRAAEEWHEYLKNDQNMLYTITYEGKTVYTNTDDSSLDGPAKKMPEGYNFLLYFDGEKVSIIKDNKTLSVYGDGYYQEDSEWYVPGYKNFTAGEKEKNATVCIAAIKSPVISISKNNGSSYWEERNQFYMIEKRHKMVNDIFVFTIVIFCLSLVFLFIFFKIRKEKKQVDVFFAKITGKIWIELKALLVCGLFVLSGFFFFSLYERNFWYMTDNMSFYIGALFIFALGIAVLFLILYAAVNDFVKNKHVWRHSFVQYIADILQSRGMQYSFQKRMVSRSRLLFLLQSAVVIIAAGGIFAVWIDNYYYTSAIWSLSFLLGLSIFVLTVALFIAAQSIFYKKNKETIIDMERLVQHIEAVHDGNLTEKMQTAEDADLSLAAKNLNEIQKGMHTALEEQIKSERMKVELVSNVSHDVKTPLTSIISYVDLLKQETELPDYIQDYVHILDSKSKRLKDMVQDVFEVSKAASGQLPVKMEALDFGKLLRQTLADMEERIEKSGLTIKTDIPAAAVMIQADGQRLYRVFQNLILNALKYSMDGTRIYVTLQVEGRKAAASIKNISREELADTLDFTERFVRGDKSRSDGGSGLGLSIAKSFTEACRGEFSIETIADLFVVKVEFNIWQESPLEDESDN